MQLSTVKSRIRKEAGIGDDIAKWIKDNPRLARGIGVGLGTGLVGTLGAKLLGSDNAALWGLGLGAGVTGLDQYLLNNPDKVPTWLEGAYKEQVKAYKDAAADKAKKQQQELYNAFVKPGAELEAKKQRRFNRRFQGPTDKLATEMLGIPSPYGEYSPTFAENVKNSVDKTYSDFYDNQAKEDAKRTENYWYPYQEDYKAKLERLSGGLKQFQNIIRKNPKLKLSQAEKDALLNNGSVENTLDYIYYEHPELLPMIEKQLSEEQLGSPAFGNKNAPKTLALLDAVVNAKGRNRAQETYDLLKNMNPEQVPGLVTPADLDPKIIKRNVGESVAQAQARRRAFLAKQRYDERLKQLRDRIAYFTR